jgi:hypothetical protein
MRLLPALALLTVGVTLPTRAQATPAGGLDSASVLELKPDRLVRLQVPDQGRLQGRVGFRSGSELLLKMDGEERRISLGGVDTLWVRGRHTRTGAIIGGILGTGGGILLGALATGLCEYDCDNNYVLSGAVFGLAAGGAAGALVGAAFPRWRRVFPD